MSATMIGSLPEGKSEFALYVEGLTVAFNGSVAVNNLNLYVEKGETRVVIGPNGEGKTTVLDLICVRTRATAGSIRFNDIELATISEHKIVRAGVGRKVQTPSDYETLSVRENLEVACPRGLSMFGALMFRLTPDVIERVEEVAEHIFLSSHLDQQA